MHFNWLFSTKAYFKVCIEAHKIWYPFFPYQSLLLSTIVLNDIVKEWNYCIRQIGNTQPIGSFHNCTYNDAKIIATYVATQ